VRVGAVKGEFMLRKLLLVAVIAAMVPSGAVLTAGAANAATTSACSGVIDIEQFAFNPPSVPVGQVSTLNLVAQNCTNQTLQGQTIWYGRFTWPGGGLPPGCPVIDPIAVPYSMGPGSLYTTSRGYEDPIAGCEATGLQVTVEFSAEGYSGVVAQASATLNIIKPTPAERGE
jgi:hypothetical protein